MVALTENGDIPIPFDWWDWSFDLPWGVAMVIAVAMGMIAAFIIGVPALRVKGLMLAVTTLAFAIAAMSWIFVQDIFTQGATNSPKVIPPSVGAVRLHRLPQVVLLLGAGAFGPGGVDGGPICARRGSVG